MGVGLCIVKSVLMLIVQKKEPKSLFKWKIEGSFILAISYTVDSEGKKNVNTKNIGTVFSKYSAAACSTEKTCLFFFLEKTQINSSYLIEGWLWIYALNAYTALK